MDARAGASPAVATRFERLSVSSPHLKSQRHPFVTARRKLRQDEMAMLKLPQNSSPRVINVDQNRATSGERPE